MKSFFLCVFLFVSTFQIVQAKTWRVNNQPGISADFSSISAAIGSSGVVNDDTIYLEGSSTSYAFATLNKRLIIIGPGYFLSNSGGNPGLQFNDQPAKVSILVDSLGSGSEFHGIQGVFYFEPNTDDIKFIRSHVNFNLNRTIANSKATDIEFRQCFLNISYAGTLENFVVTNCIIQNLRISDGINGLIRNNTFSGSCSANNSYLSNNIFLSNITLTNCSVKNSLSTSNNLPAGLNNKVNVPLGSLIVNAGSDDGKYMLTTNSEAKSAGETINGETPDAGAFGTSDPYRLSGIPAIPSIYALQAPSSVPSTATTMTVTISTRSNN
jgi:hypothetical protein